MGDHASDAVEEVRRLQRCMNDLVSVLALPAVWSGSEPGRVLETFLDALVGMLNLDFCYVRVRIESKDKPLEVLRVSRLWASRYRCDHMLEGLQDSFGEDPEQWPGETRRRFDDEVYSIAPKPLGIGGELGLLVAGTRRDGFPEDTERLIVSVTANQAAIGLQQARMLSEQKRIARELDERVVERTRELEEANKELQLQVGLLQHLPASTWTLKPDGTPDFVNRVWLEFSGQTLEFVRSHSEAWMTAVHSDDRERASKALWDGVRSGTGFAVEARFLRASDKTWRWHLQQAVVVRDAEGKVLRFVGTTTDIDEQKRAAEAVRASEGKLRRVIDTIPTLTWSMFPDGSNEFLSRKWHEFTGLPVEESHGWNWQVAFHPDDLPALLKKWMDMLAVGEPGEQEARLRRFDGVYRWFLIRAAPYRDETGTIVRWYGTSTDIHDRKLAEEALRASEAQLRQTVDSIPGLVCTMSLTGEVTTLNKQLLDYFGKTPEELKSWKMTDAVHPDDLPHVIAALEYSIRTGTPYEVEHRCLRADGIYRWFQVRALPVQDKDGQGAGWYVLLTDIEDRRRAEEELKRSEGRHRVVVETASDAVISIDESGAIILANPATKRVFGHNPEALIGKPVTVLMPEAMRSFHRSGYKRYLETGMRRLNWQGTEVKALRADGTEFPAEVSFGELTANGRRIFTGFIRDISEKKRAEEAILASEKNLRLTINTMPVLAWSALPDGGADFFNQRWLDYTGLTAEDAVGWGWSTAFHTDDSERVAEYWRSHIARGEAGEIEARLRRCDGQYRWFLLRANPLRNESGAIVKWYGTNTDIHDRKLAEEQVQRSEAFLAEAQRLTRVGSFSWRVAADAIEWSEQLYRIFEFDPGTAMTHDLIGSRFHPEDRPLLEEMVEKARGGSAALEYGHRLLMPGGAVKYLRLVAHASRDHEGRLEYIGAVQDVTQQQQAQEALSKARSELAHVSRITSLSGFTASIAHEINQPLSGITTNASTCLRMLNANPPNVNGARETARRTIRDADRASAVIARLRALFTGKEVKTEPVDINEIVREVIALYLNELQGNHVTLRQNFAEGLPGVMGDRIQLQQVILNLLRNASDAMSAVQDRPRELVISTEPAGEEVHVKVRDAGIGIDPAKAERLFESFYTTKKDGMGIGLSVSRSIVEAHDGRLWVMPNDGPGATFAFSVPCSLLPVIPAGRPKEGSRI
jgi:PAS domain S-box-containing protein